MRDFSVQTRAIILASTACAAVIWLGLLPDFLALAPTLLFGCLLFLVAAAAAEHLGVPLQHGGVVSISTIVHMAGVTLLPLPAVVILTALAVASHQVITRSPWYKIGFNTASITLTVAATKLTTRLLGNPLALAEEQPLISLASLLLAAGTYYACTNSLLALLLASVKRESLLATLGGYIDSAPLELATAIIGGMAGFIWYHQPWWALGMLFPTALTYFSLDYLNRMVADRKMEEALRRSEERFRALVQHASDIICILDVSGVIRYQSPSVLTLLGFTPGDMTGRDMADFLHPDDAEAFRRSLAALGAHQAQSNTSEWRVRHASGGWSQVEAIATNLLDEPGVNGIVLNARDITERKRAEDALAHQALHDALTGLPNRTLLRQRLELEIQHARRDRHALALLLMDLNRFKEVNDTLGHASGDLLLQQVARRLEGALRASDTVARLGGDEFAVLLPAADLAGALDCTQRLLDALGVPMLIDGHMLDIGASIGIGLFPEHGMDADTLVRHADVAMYAAKRAGGGWSVYASEQDQHTAERLALVGELRAAIERGELVLHYQPKVDLATGRVGSVEALVRWLHPRHGLIQSDRFISLAEETGLIAPLTQWVLDAALRQCQVWREAGEAIPVAVNFSMRNLQEPRLPEMVAGLLERYAMPRGWLTVEITESALMADPDRTMETLGRLRALGVRIAMDDFGTGYSSFVHLHRLAVNELKIDRSFVGDMGSEESGRVIVRSIIELGHNLGLSVVAEGVEDADTLDLLAAAGCDEAQGFYLSRPIPADELLAWMQARHARLEAGGPDDLRHPVVRQARQLAWGPAALTGKYRQAAASAG